MYLKLLLQAAPGPLASGWPVSWGSQGQAAGSVLQRPRALLVVAHWPGPGFEAAVNLSPRPHLHDLMLVASPSPHPANLWISGPNPAGPNKAPTKAPRTCCL